MGFYSIPVYSELTEIVHVARRLFPLRIQDEVSSISAPDVLIPDAFPFCGIWGVKGFIDIYCLGVHTRIEDMARRCD